MLCMAMSYGMLAQVLLVAPICKGHRRFRLPYSCTYAALWLETFEAVTMAGVRRGRRDLRRCETRQYAQLLDFTFFTCCSRLLPLRRVLVFSFRPNFFARPWAITLENFYPGSPQL